MGTSAAWLGHHSGSFTLSTLWEARVVANCLEVGVTGCPLARSRVLGEGDRGHRQLPADVYEEGLSRFSLRQPPALLLAMICVNIAARAATLMVSPSRIATVRAVCCRGPR